MRSKPFARQAQMLDRLSSVWARPKWIMIDQISSKLECGPFAGWVIATWVGRFTKLSVMRGGAKPLANQRTIFFDKWMTATYTYISRFYQLYFNAHTLFWKFQLVPVCASQKTSHNLLPENILSPSTQIFITVYTFHWYSLHKKRI